MALKLCMNSMFNRSFCKNCVIPASRSFSSCSRISSGTLSLLANNRSQSDNIVVFRQFPFHVHFSTGSITLSIWQKMGFTGKFKFKKQTLKRSALRLYLCCMELPDYNAILQELGLEDSFNAWFRLVGLHVWIAMVRLSAEGPEGKFMRNEMMESLWKDVSAKSRKLGELASFTSRTEGIQLLADQFKASLFSYDEGLMADDTVLAGALWRNLFDKNCKHASHLELMVEYVRKQVSHLDTIDSNSLLQGGLLTFLPLHDTAANKDRHQTILNEIAKSV